MNIFREKILVEFSKVHLDILKTEGMQRIENGSISLAHYASYLRQVFHHTRCNPQMQTFATAFFRGGQRKVIKRFYQHATSEIGHDQLALNDIMALGFDVSGVEFERPLPETTALIGYPFYQIQHKNPLGYLGYLYYLEFTPTSYGEHVIDILKTVGVPDQALSFIKEHATVDVAHNRLMEEYLSLLVTSEQQADEVCYAIRTTGILYSNMISAAFRAVDEGYNYTQYGMDPDECDDVAFESIARNKKHRLTEVPAI